MAFIKSLVSIVFFSLFLSATNAVLVIKGATGGVQTRLEIRQLFNTNKNQWNLFLLAMFQLQSLDQSGVGSYFQMGGIHGSPAIPWDGVQQSAPGVGYCTHSINLFAIWHRPYLALFEQRLQEAAITKANKFSGSDRTMYLNLAQTLRLPFYDWAAAPANGQTWPLVLSQKYVTVNTAIGQQTIINPLFRYNFNPAPNPAPYTTPWSQWQATLRNPNSNDSGAVSNNDITAATMNQNRVAQRQSLYNWFTLCPDWDQSSNDGAADSSGSCHISLESLHNNVHVWIGGNGNGHMTVVPVSAHDPSFWLHHAMIDRLLAMWQVLYPNSWITNRPSPVNTFTINQGSTQGPDSDLTPFHRTAAGDFWTPNLSRSTKTFNYQYPEMADSDGSAASIRTYINNLYGPNANANAGSSKRSLESRQTIGNITSTITGTVGDALNGIPTVPAAVTTATNGSTYQYIANVQTTRWKLGTSYVVYFFFGAPTSEISSSWGTDSKLVGSYGVFAGPGMTMNDIVSTSTVPLTDALTLAASKGQIESLQQALVIPFLQQNLEWRVATSDGTTLDPSQVPNFLVSVVASTMTVPASADEFPTWSDFHTLTQITSGKKGGVAKLSQILNTLGKRETIPAVPYEGPVGEIEA